MYLYASESAHVGRSQLHWHAASQDFVFSGLYVNRSCMEHLYDLATPYQMYFPSLDRCVLIIQQLPANEQ